VLNDGVIVEMGPPSELLVKEGGIFRAMREAQNISSSSSSSTTPTDPPASSAAAVAVERKQSRIVTSERSRDGVAAPAVATAGEVALAVTGDGAGTPPSESSPPSPPPPLPFLRVAAYNAPELLWAVLGLLSCGVTGATMPAFALLLSRFINIYFDPDGGAVWRNAIFYMGMFFLIGGANFFGCILQQYAFGLMGERLVRRVRAAAFSSILRFEISWHDAHPVGSVTSALGTDAYLLRSATGPTLALTIQNCVGLVAGLIIAFQASWRITLVVLCVAPLLALGGMVHLKMMLGSNEEVRGACVCHSHPPLSASHTHTHIRPPLSHRARRHSVKAVPWPRRPSPPPAP